jgi:hypothetical protein
MNPESLRIADQLRRAFNGQAWHGAPLRELLTGISGDQAGAHALPSAHSIWELVQHIDIYTRAAWDATRSIPIPRLFETQSDWPAMNGSWEATRNQLFENADQLAQAIEAFEDARLQEIVPGRTYDFYFLFHGVLQHSLYHAGQIALLKGGLQAR